jgi:hypothetical protein
MNLLTAKTYLRIQNILRQITFFLVQDELSKAIIAFLLNYHQWHNHAFYLKSKQLQKRQ